MILIVGAIGLLFSCATGGGRQAAPDWVLNPPLSDDEYELFYASATDPAGDMAAAEEAAGYSLLAQINQALGVDISVETSSTARASLEEYEADLVQTVTQSATGRIAGFRVQDRYVQESDVGVTVHVLGQYEKGAFAAEQARREQIRREALELFLGPEQDAEAAAASGDYLVAVEQYIQAAVAAAESELEEAASARPRALQRAAEIMSALALEPVSAPREAALGSEPPQPFVSQLLYVDGSSRTPISGVPVSVSYETSGRTGRTTIRTERVLTDEDGLAVFNHPETDSAGQLNVSMRLEVDQINQLLTGIPRENSDLTGAIRDGMADQLARFRFTVVSRAREIPTAIAIVDTDIDGVVFSEVRAANAVVQSLSQNGFNVRLLGVDSATLDATRGPALLDLIREESGASIERAVYGSAVVVDVDDSGDQVLVKVSAEVNAVDLATGSILYSASVLKQGRASSAERAAAAAFRDAGELLGQELASNLP